MRKRFTSLVDREEQLNQVKEIVKNVRSGRGAVITIIGEPGIGKTRMADEVLNVASKNGYKIMRGGAYSVGSDTAYTPIIEMFNQYFRGVDSKKIASWTKDLPDLGKLSRRLQLPDPVKVEDPALEKTRLFESMACLVDRISEGQPLMIVQEDLHFADPASLEFLHYLSRGIKDLPYLLVVTVDAFELAANSYANSLIQSLRKGPFYKEIYLNRLSEDGIKSMLMERLGSTLPDGLLSLMINHSEGVPLFVDELLHSLEEKGALMKKDEAWVLSVDSIEKIPYRIKELIKERIQRIDSIGQKVLLYIAIAKGTVPHQILNDVMQMGEDELLYTIQQLQLSGLVYEEVQEMEVYYGIYHTLVKEVVVEEYPIMVRRRAYKSFIDIMEANGYDDVEYLAHLYFGAGSEADPARTLSVFLQEAERALSLYAYSSSAKYFKSALQVLTKNKALNEKQRVPFILKRLGEVHRMLGDRSEAQRYCLEAIRTFVQYNNQKEIAGLHGTLAVIYWDSGDIDESLKYLEDGLSIAENMSEYPEVRFDLLQHKLLFLSRLKKSKEYHEVFMEIQEVHKFVGTRRAAAQAKVAEINYWGCHFLKEKSMPGKIQDLILQLEKLEAEDDALFHGYFFVSFSLIYCGKYELSRLYSAKALKVAQRMRILEYEIRSYFLMVHADVLEGNWKQAVQKVQTSFSKASKIDVGRPLVHSYLTKGIVNAVIGQYDEAQKCLDEIKIQIPGFITKDEHLKDIMSPIDMLIALGTGKASDYYARVKDKKSNFVVLPILNTSLWGEVLLEAGNEEGALEEANKLLSEKPEESPFSWALGKRLLAKINYKLGDRDKSVVEIQEAADYFKMLNMSLEEARTLLAYAVMVHEKDPEKAKLVLQQCLETFEKCEIEADINETQILMKKVGIRVPKTSNRDKEIDLSKREIEVANLVAHGMTNQQIAEELYISPRTVSTHLEKIYRRLGINSRASLVKYLVDHDVSLDKTNT